MEAKEDPEDLQQQLFALLNDDDLETAENILEWKPGLANRVYQTNHGGTTLLIEACSEGRLGATKLLLKYGADIRNIEPIISCGHLLDYQEAPYLIDVFPLFVAAREGHLSIVKELLQAGAPVNQTNALGQSALHACCICHSEGSENYPEHMLKIMTTLIDHGANINLQDHKGKTPLHYACDPFQESCIKILLENGAHFTLRDNDGNSALNILRFRRQPMAMGFLRNSNNNSPYSFHFPMLCMRYATSARPEDEAMIILLKMCDFTLEEIIELYETTGTFRLMRKATEMRELHNMPKLEACKNDPEQLRRQAELASERIRKEQTINPCHLLLPEILKVINTKYSYNASLAKSVNDYLILHGLSSEGTSSLPQDNFKLDKNKFELLETDSVTEFIKGVMTSGQKMQKQLEIDTEPLDTVQVSLKLVQILDIAVNLILQLVQRELENGTTNKIKQLLQELWEKFPEVQFKFVDSCPRSRIAREYIKQFQQFLQPRFSVSLPLPYIILCYGIAITMDCGSLYTETVFELLLVMFIQLGFDINTTDGEGNTLLHYAVRSVLEDINPRSVNVQPVYVLKPVNVQPGNVRLGYVEPDDFQLLQAAEMVVEPSYFIANKPVVSEPKNIVILLLRSGAYLHAKNILRESALDLLRDSSNNFEVLIQLMEQYDEFPSLQHLAAITVRNSNLPYETLLPIFLTKFVDIH